MKSKFSYPLDFLHLPAFCIFVSVKYDKTFLFLFFSYLPFSWLNTTMTENRKVLDASDLDGFDKVNISYYIS